MVLVAENNHRTAYELHEAMCDRSRSLSFLFLPADDSKQEVAGNCMFRHGAMKEVLIFNIIILFSMLTF